MFGPYRRRSTITRREASIIFGPRAAPPNGYFTPKAWDALAFVDGDVFSQTAVSTTLTPRVGSVAATAAIAVPGVFVDINGNPRPASGPWTAGALQT